MKKRAIILQFFNSPQNPINLCSSLIVKKVSQSELDEGYYSYTDIQLYGFEVNGFNINECTILEGIDEKIQDNCYIALLDLYTRHWRYESYFPHKKKVAFSDLFQLVGIKKFKFC